MADPTSPPPWLRPAGVEPDASAQQPVVVDCDGCAVRGLACADCVVTVLLGPEIPRWDADEMSALDALAGVGLVPPLRLVQAVDSVGPVGDAPAAPDASVPDGVDEPDPGTAGQSAEGDAS